MAEDIDTKHIGDTPRDCPMGDWILRRTTAGIVVSASLQGSNVPRQSDPSLVPHFTYLPTRRRNLSCSLGNFQAST